jgi:hypothetical protein
VIQGTYMSNFTHWFFVYKATDALGDSGFTIFTAGLGNHPVGKYWYDTIEELEIAIKKFVDDGYKMFDKRA